MKKIIAGYARVSSREQADDTHALEQQKARLEAAGATETYTDIQSGKRDNRPELKKLMNLVRAKQVHEVIITRLDRMARSLLKIRDCVDIFNDTGVNLRVLDQQFDLSTAQGKLMVNILGSMAEWEVDQLSERVIHGKEHRKKQHIACESNPWGYKVVKDKYVLDRKPYLCLLESRPENYLALYKEEDLTKLSCLTVYNISRDCIETFLEHKSVPKTLKVIYGKYGLFKTNSKVNGSDEILSWSRSGFNVWINNPVLRGHTVYSKTSKDSSGKRIPVKKEDWRFIYDTHPNERLVSDEEAEEIKTIYKFNSNIRGKTLNHNFSISGTYLKYSYQTGLVYCAECGSKCSSKTCICTTGTYNYFACRHARIGCTNLKSTRKQTIEDVLLQTLVEKSNSLQNLEEETLIDETGNESANNHSLNELKHRLKALEQIPGKDPYFEDLKADLRQQIAWESKLVSTGSLVNKTTPEIIRAGNNLAFWQTLSNDDKVKVYQKIIKKITVSNGQVVSITFNL